MSGAAAKRALDVAVAALGLVAASPVLLLAALAVKLEDGGPALYRQERVGRDGRSFRLLKFRSMRVNAASVAEIGQVTSGHPLVTRTGRWLRRLKIDEAPQLLNVLGGDMSLVGPRPTVREQVDAYTPWERRRLAVRPGMSGWAQVNGNTELSWSQRIDLDVWYVDHWSFGLDVAILLRTLMVVARGERIDPGAVERAREHAERTGRSG